MSHSDSRDRRRRAAVLDPDCLETRQLLTGGQGNTFAIMPVVADAPGGSVKSAFTLAPSHFTVPKGKIVLGLDIAVPQQSNARPSIVGVADATGKPIRDLQYSLYDPRATRKAAAAQTLESSAVLATLDLRKAPAGSTPSYSVTVSYAKDTNGNALLGYYLPGDVNGDGLVDKTDIKAVRAALNSTSEGSRYNFEADANRDGRIGMNDFKIARQNEGVRTIISPVITANLDPASDTGLADRVTAAQTVKFTGAASPGSNVTFTETGNKVAPTTVQSGADGQYAIGIGLASGANTFKVTTVDAFGQTISGTIAPVTYTTQAAVQPSTTLPFSTTPSTRTGVGQS